MVSLNTFQNHYNFYSPSSHLCFSHYFFTSCVFMYSLIYCCNYTVTAYFCLLTFVLALCFVWFISFIMCVPCQWEFFAFQYFLFFFQILKDILLYIIYLFIYLNLFIYFYSVTIVCIFSPSLHPTPASPTSLPHLYPPPWFCPCLLVFLIFCS